LAIASAQAPPPPQADVIFERRIMGPAGAGDVTFEFVGGEMAFGAAVVKNAPYTADAVTETTQTLSDGNHIRRKNTASVARDSEGRTRRSQQLGAIGPFLPAGEAPEMIFITDPVAGVEYILDVRNKIARKLPLPPALKGRAGTVGYQAFGALGPPPPPLAGAGPLAAGQAVFIRREVTEQAVAGQAAAPRVKPLGDNVKTESLGTRIVEGIEAEGSRTTVTIPAGAIGNERLIESVSERWVSPKLQTVVQSRRSDPREGETVYRLMNLSQREPAQSLFEVPPDYTIREEKPFIQRLPPPPAP
jgi:hypothetical protein